MDRLRTIGAIAATLVLAASAGASELPCSEEGDPRLAEMSDDGIGFTSALGLGDGRYALPETTAPTQLVVMFHGHGNDSCSWRKHLRDAASLGAVAIAMDYVDRRPESVNYGWFMRRAAADSNAAARYFLAAYPSITQVFAMGISMGGNASGFAIAAQPKRLDDTTPLFDYWVDVEGVNNLTEEYTVARSVAPANGGAALAQQEIEEENGGALEQQPERYEELTNVSRAPDMSTLKGAVVVNGVDDGLVTTDQSPQMADALNAVGVPTHRYTILVRPEDDTESDTTASCIPFSAASLPCPATFAGHGWEGSEKHIVIATGFAHLWALMDGDQPVPGETVTGLPEPGQGAMLAAGAATLLLLAQRSARRLRARARP